MLKPNEVRVGNLVWHPTLETIVEINWSYIRDMANINFSGVQITGEWLERFGFEKTHTWLALFCIDGLATIECSYDKKECWLDFEGTICGKPIQYVHQLQNLYFSLTGEELKIRETV